MNRETIERLLARIMSYRLRASVTTAELEDLARDAGRAQDKNGNWISEHMTDSSPLVIPTSPPDLNRYTADVILFQLEEDLYDIEDLLNYFEENDNDQIN
jgi:hypothetical protein